MKNFKKTIALCAALAMMIMTMVPVGVVAADPTYALAGTDDSLALLVEDNVLSAETDGTITVQMQAGAGWTGSLFTGYKLLEVTNSGGNLYVTIPAKMQAFWDDCIGGTGVTMTDIKNKLAGGLSAANIIAKFNSYYNGLSSSEKSALADAISNAVGSDGKTKFENVDLGLWAVMQTGAPADGYIASSPILACLPMKSGADWINAFTVDPKNDTISADKTITDVMDRVTRVTASTGNAEEASANIGDTVSYKIEGKLPVYGVDVTTVKYILEDTLSLGLTLDRSSVTVKVSADGGLTWSTLDSTYYDLDSADRSLKVDLSANYKANIQGVYDHVKVEYNAVLNDAAAVNGEGNDNTVELQYTRTSKDDTGSFKDKTKVYTYGLNLKKVDAADNSVLLSGAEFELYRGTSSTGGTAISFVESGDSTAYSYRVATASDVMTTETLKIGTNGTLSITGLADYTYKLKETVAPATYNLPDAEALPVITINGHGNSTISDMDNKANIDGYYQPDLTIPTKIIENSTGVVVPTTGGIGTIIFTLLGFLLIAGAIFLIFGKRKTADNRQQ